MRNKILFWVGIALVVAGVAGPVAQATMSDRTLGWQPETFRGYDMPMGPGEHPAPWMYDDEEADPLPSSRRGPSTDQARP